MVKPGVYTVESEKEKVEKELKKEALKKPPLDIVPPIITIEPGAEDAGCCCTKRKLLVALLILILLGIAIVAGGLTYKYMRHHGEHKKQRFDCHVEFDKDPTHGKQEGGVPVEDLSGSNSRPDDHDHEPDRPYPPRPTPPKHRPPPPPGHRPTPPPRHPPTPPQRHPTTPKHSNVGSLDEEIEVDEEYKTEKFEIPANEECERVTVIHDFNKGVTGYRLWTSNYCFVKPLDLGCIPPFMLSAMMMDPNYLRDHFQMVREEYLAVPPPMTIQQLRDYAGDFIASRCTDVPTYFLEPNQDIEDSGEWESFDESYESYDSGFPEEPMWPAPDVPYPDPRDILDGMDEWFRQPTERKRRESKEGMKHSKVVFFDGAKVRELKIKLPLK